MMVPAAIRKVPRVTLMFWAIDLITKPHGEGGLELGRNEPDRCWMLDACRRLAS